MNPRYKSKYDEMMENDPNSPEAREQAKIKTQDKVYPSEGNTRNVCFELLTGYRIFLNYAYLISGDYKPDNNSIILCFTTHTVTLNGICLESLFFDFMQHIPRYIKCTEERYNDITTDIEVVNTIQIISSER